LKTLRFAAALLTPRRRSYPDEVTSLHDSLTVIDGLVVSKWSRAVFADLRKGGLTAANCTCPI
jgi:hypothetical protein